MGGAGTDTVDYSKVDNSKLDRDLTINIARDLDSIERVIGSQGPDQFLISRDVFTQEPGNLDINGGSEFGNTLDYSNMKTPVSIDIDAGKSTYKLGNQTFEHTFSKIQRVIGSQLDDTFYGGEEKTHFNGEGGTDTVRYDSAKGVVINLQDLTKNKGWAEGDTYENMEWFVGSNGDDILTANVTWKLPNNQFAGRFLRALKGEDQLIGDKGNDVLDFNLGNDNLKGDIAKGNDGDDRILIDWSHISNKDSHDSRTLIDGGPGKDTLEIYGSGSVDLTDLSSLKGDGDGDADYSNINSIEVINLIKVTDIKSVKVTQEVIQGLVDADSPPKLELVMGNRNVTFDFGDNQVVNEFANGRVVFLSGNNVVAELQINYI